MPRIYITVSQSSFLALTKDDIRAAIRQGIKAITPVVAKDVASEAPRKTGQLQRSIKPYRRGRVFGVHATGKAADYASDPDVLYAGKRGRRKTAYPNRGFIRTFKRKSTYAIMENAIIAELNRRL